MSSKTLLCAALALLLAGGAIGTAAAQASDVPSPPPPPPGGTAGAHWPGPHTDDLGPPGMAGAEQGVIADLRNLAGLYRMAGREKEMSAVYQEVLGKSQDPRVRNYAYQQLARLQAQPTNLDQAIATLRRSLDENLSLEARQRAEREAMRAQWAQPQRADGANKP